MLEALSRWFSSHARQARVSEVFGNLAEACEQYLLAGLTDDAARVLEKLADTEALAPEAKLRHYAQALELLEQRELDEDSIQRVTTKMVPLMEGAPVGSPVFRRRCELLQRLGMSRELGAELERATDFAGAVQVYVEAGLLEEIERASELARRVREKRRHLEELFEALDVARTKGDRLEELRALRGLSSEAEDSSHISSARTDLAKLGPRLLGRRLCLASDALRAPFDLLVGTSLTIGRDPDNDLHFGAPGVSRHHMRVYAYDSRIFVEDLQSHNGTWLDGLKVEGFVEVRDKVRLRLGPEGELDLEVLASAAPDAPAVLLSGTGLGRPTVLVSGGFVLRVGSSTIDVRHPAFIDRESIFRIESGDDQPVIAPVGGGPSILLGGKNLETPQMLYSGEAIVVGGVPFSLRRLDQASPAAWDPRAEPRMRWRASGDKPREKDGTLLPGLAKALNPPFPGEEFERFLAAGQIDEAATLLLEHGRGREALELHIDRNDSGAALRVAEAIAMDSAQVRLELGRRFVARGWFVQAEGLLRPLLNHGQGALLPEARLTLAEALLGAGRDREARGELERGLAEDVTNPGLWRMLAQTRVGHEQTTTAISVQPDRFTLRQLLGRGGSGKVYLATDADRGGPVALKILDEPPPRSSLESLFQGVRLVAGLPPHPNVLPVLDIDPRLRLVISPYLPGGSLQNASKTRMEPGRWARLLREIARGLGHLHRYGVLHLDLKPANVLLTQRDTAVLSDFSLCRRAEPPWPRLGSVDYASPEALLGEPLDASTDVYSLGIVAYELAAGARPFPTGTPIRTEAYRPISELRSDFPTDAAQFIDEMLRLESRQRLSLAELELRLARLSEKSA